MSRSALVISLLLVVALSIVGIALLMSPPQPATAGNAASLLRLDPSQVASFTVTGSGDTSVITRTSAGGWTIHLQREGEPLTSPWPAQPTQVRSMVRSLCDLRDVSANQGTMLQSVDATLTVEIAMAGGEKHEVRFDAAPLGGRRLIGIDQRRTGEIDDAIFRALTSPGPAQWRVKSPFHGVGERTSRITLRSPGTGSGVELARLEGRWFLRQPIQSRASGDAAQDLLRSLGSLTIERFIDDTTTLTMTESGLDAPRLLCTIEEDRRSIDSVDGQIRTQTQTQTLAIGGPADLSGRLVYASINDGQTFVVINIESIASVSLNGESYLAPFAAETISQNIGGFAVRIAGQPEARFERGISDWRRLDATGATIGESPSEPIETLLAAFTTSPASRLVIDEPEQYRPIASVTLFDFGGGAMETIEAGVIDEGVLAFRSGQVFRIYEELETPSLLMPGGLR